MWRSYILPSCHWWWYYNLPYDPWTTVPYPKHGHNTSLWGCECHCLPSMSIVNTELYFNQCPIFSELPKVWSIEDETFLAGVSLLLVSFPFPHLALIDLLVYINTDFTIPHFQIISDWLIIIWLCLYCPIILVCNGPTFVLVSITHCIVRLKYRNHFDHYYSVVIVEYSLATSNRRCGRDFVLYVMGKNNAFLCAE